MLPHQPRLDWQMWFAALGSYNHNPWLLSLVYRFIHNYYLSILGPGQVKVRLLGSESKLKIKFKEFDLTYTTFLEDLSPANKQ